MRQTQPTIYANEHCTWLNPLHHIALLPKSTAEEFLCSKNISSFNIRELVISVCLYCLWIELNRLLRHFRWIKGEHCSCLNLMLNRLFFIELKWDVTMKPAFAQAWHWRYLQASVILAAIAVNMNSVLHVVNRKRYQRDWNDICMRYTLPQVDGSSSNAPKCSYSIR